MQGSVFRPKSLAEAQEFLATLDVNKSLSFRLFSWLLALGCCSPDSDCLATIYQNYQTTLKSHFSDLQNPLGTVPDAARAIILVDIPRIIAWFTDAGRILNVPIPSSEVFTFHAHRVLSALTLVDPFYSYTQGMDRYMALTYLIGLSFTRPAKPDLAEAISFTLTEKLLRLANFQSILTDKTQSRFVKLDKLLAKRYPALDLGSPPRYGSASMLFALSWRLLFFADQHDVRYVFLIWDSIILRKDSCEEFFNDLALAHIRQVPLKGPSNAVSQIMACHDWNVPALLHESQREFQSRRDRRSLVIQIVLTLIILFQAGHLFFANL
jgi:hypothetical protein